MTVSRETNLARALLAWYDRHARVLPWRVSPQDRKQGVVPDPYRVWLVEVMLQQTRVATVAHYFDKFVRRWPTVGALAQSPTSAVMQEWAGMGYYARARNLHAAAKIMAEDFAGTVPRTESELLQLPGVGDYTAAAIAAIAYNQPTAPVDGNVKRVISRLYAIDKVSTAAMTAIRDRTATLVPRRRPGDFVQALMDLGATICTPRSPNCTACPWRLQCRAYKEGRVNELPVRTPRSDGAVRYGVVFVVTRRDGALLVERRADTGMFGGMVVLPGTDWFKRRPTAAAIRQAEPVSADWHPVDGVITHSVSDFQIQLSVRRARVRKNCRLLRGYWLSSEDIAGEALPRTMRKALALSMPVADES